MDGEKKIVNDAGNKISLGESSICLILFNIIGGRLSTVVSILLAAVVYIVLLVLTGSITPEDMALLPKGDKIKNKLGKYNIFDKNKEK